MSAVDPVPLVIQEDTADGPALTGRGLAALDLLADVIVHEAARTPAGITHALDEAMHAPLLDLRQVLSVLDRHLQSRCL